MPLTKIFIKKGLTFFPVQLFSFSRTAHQPSGQQFSRATNLHVFQARHLPAKQHNADARRAKFIDSLILVCRHGKTQNVFEYSK